MINQLIKTLYDPKCNLTKDVIFYDRLLEQIERYSISPQVYSLLRKQGKLADTPLSFQKRLKQMYQRALFTNMFIKGQTDQLLEKFETMGLSVIPLKGVYFAEQYFGHIGARGTTDIDILIRKQDLYKVIDLVIAMGFEIEEEAFPEHFHTSFIKFIPDAPLPVKVEIH